MKYPQLNPKLIILLASTLMGLSYHAYLGSFSRFIADDYCSAAEEIKLGIFRAAWYWYIAWTGRYSANLLDAIFGKLGPDFSPVVTSLVLIIWLAASGAATFVFLPISEKGKRVMISATLASTVLFLTLTLTPNVQQSLYWGQGMRSVIPPLIIGTAFSSCIQLNRGRIPSPRSFILWLSVGMMICFIAGGFNETYTIFQVGILLLAIGIFLISKKNISDKGSFLFLLAGFLGATLSLLAVLIAPGNHFRQAYFPPPPPFPNLIAIAINSFWLYFIQIFNSITKILALVGAIVIGGLVGTISDIKLGSTKTPFYILLIGLGLIFSCFPPAAYGLSDAPPERTLIIPTYGLVIILVILGFSLGQLLHQNPQIYQIFLVGSLILILILVAISINQMASTRQIYINYATAWWQFHERMLSYQKAGTIDVVISTQVMNSNNWTKLDVLGDNPKFWLNKCISDYYGVKVTSNTPPP